MRNGNPTYSAALALEDCPAGYREDCCENGSRLYERRQTRSRWAECDARRQTLPFPAARRPRRHRRAQHRNQELESTGRSSCPARAHIALTIARMSTPRAAPICAILHNPRHFFGKSPQRQAAKTLARTDFPSESAARFARLGRVATNTATLWRFAQSYIIGAPYGVRTTDLQRR
jgi:hypothetical protein